MKYKLTVIIPCYNSEKYISRCVNSVINQTIGFENIELILYDDASTDNTKEIIQSYSEKYSNIKPIFSSTNSGNPGKGRNEGIKYSTSPYIMFLDHDDEYDEDMCNILFNEIENEDVDIVACSALNYNKFGMERLNLDVTCGVPFENKVIFNTPIYSNARLIWTCIFKKQLISSINLKFPEDRLGEDIYFMMMYLLNSNKFIYLKDYYGVNRFVQYDSASNSQDLDKLKKIFNLYDEILNILENENLNLSVIFEDRISGTLTLFYTSNMIFEPRDKIYEIFDDLNELEKRINFKGRLSSVLNIGNKLITMNNYKLAILYFKVLHKLFLNNKLMKFYRKLIKLN